MTEEAKPWIAVTPQIALKVAASTVLMATGMYYLTTGRRDADTGRMIKGAILALASVFIFLV